MVDAWCKQCGHKILKIKEELIANNNFFCSPKCRDVWIREMMEDKN